MQHFLAKYIGPPLLVGDTGELTWFRRFLCAKVCLLELVSFVAFGGSVLLTLLLIVAMTLSFDRTKYGLGLVVVLLYAVWGVLVTFPYTINHKGYEVFALLLLAATIRRDPTQRKRLSGAACDACRISILAVWFYSGAQKLVENYYVSGEIFVLAVHQNSGQLGETLRFLISLFYGVDAEIFELTTTAFGITSSPYPVQVIAFLQGLAVTTVAAELILPLWAIKSQIGAAALIGLNLIIAVVTGEWDIAFTSISCLLLFFPSSCSVTYPILTVLLLVELVFSFFS